jgi:GNAT superfamily N-acetyltransferase
MDHVQKAAKSGRLFCFRKTKTRQAVQLAETLKPQEDEGTAPMLNTMIETQAEAIDLRPGVIVTRKAKQTDLADLKTMIEALASHHGDIAETSTATLETDLFGPVPWITAFVAESERGIMGYAILFPLYRAQEGKRGMELHHLFVKPEFRGQGIGRHLIDKARTHARISGCAYLSVSAATGNIKAHRFYEQLEFTPRPVTGMRFTKVLG